MGVCQNDLADMMRQHRLWLEGKNDRPDFRWANLSNLDLRGVDFRGADLSEADLSNSKLSNSNLSGCLLNEAKFREANLLYANLSSSILVRADFTSAFLQYANLMQTDSTCAKFTGANMTTSNLSYGYFTSAKFLSAHLAGSNVSNANAENADFACADLRGAKFNGALLIGANLTDAKINHDSTGLVLACPEKGSFIGYKKARGLIVELLITEDALRSSATTRKCRCSKAKVLSIAGDNEENFNIVHSDYDYDFIYKVGETVEVTDFDKDRWKECSTGIHFFLTKQEAIAY
jgi:uncharacterized protein YjbI with pentapeptide repeats